MSKRTKGSRQRNRNELPSLPIFDPYAILNSTTLCSRENHQRKKNCVANPKCIFGLGESNEGIWHKDATRTFLYKGLGVDLRAMKRPEYDSSGLVGRSSISHVSSAKLRVAPVGLRNLGATCYLNALIQCFYHNQYIREAILRINTEERTLAMESMHEMDFASRSNRVIDALQMTFAHMKHSNEAVYDLAPLTDLLGLDTGEQQDLHELSSLLVALISKVDSAPGCATIAQLINGRQQFSVSCQNCSHVSSREETFCELDLAVEGQQSIGESLEQYLSEEMLQGDNKYDCSSCRSRQEATRATAIVAAPPVLFVQLRRNVYDMKTYQKNKLKTSIQYPPTLSILDDTYKLTAVVYHRGASAYGGHYITEVLNWEDDSWWLCDDSTVLLSPLGPCQLSPEKPAPAAEEVEDLTQEEEENTYLTASPMRHGGVEAAEERGCLRGCGLVAVDSLQQLTASAPERCVDGDEAPSAASIRASGGDASCAAKNKSSSARSNAATAQGKSIQEYEQLHKLNRSKDVYMLLYVKEKRGERPPPATYTDVHAAENALTSIDQSNYKPKHLEAVQRRNDSFSESLAEYIEGANSIQHQITKRQVDYKSFEAFCTADSSTGSSMDDMNILVPTQWLRSWITGQAVSSQSTTVPPSVTSPGGNNPFCDLTGDASQPLPCSDFSGPSFHKQQVVFSQNICNIPFVCPHSAAYRGPGTSDAPCLTDDLGNNYLHPHTIADHFKIIPHAAYKILEASILARGTGGTLTPAEVVDRQFTNFNVKCDVCISLEMSKKEDLKESHKCLSTLLNLLNDSNGSGDKLDFEGKDGVAGRYVVEKKWITWLKKKVDNLQKEMSDRKKKKKSKSVAEFFVSGEGALPSPVLSSVETVEPTVVVLEDNEDISSYADRASGVSADVTADTNTQQEGGRMGEAMAMGPNEALLCPHSLLVPGFQRRVRYVSAAAWVALQELFPEAVVVFAASAQSTAEEVKAASSKKGRQKKRTLQKAVMHEPRVECAECLQQSFLQREILQGHQQCRKEERTGEYRSLGELARRSTCFSSAPLDPDLVYYVIDGLWLQQWRSYTLDMNGEVVRPGFLTNATLRCQHGGLNIPKLLTDKLQSSAEREKSVESTSYNFSRNEDDDFLDEAPICELVTQQQWEALGNLGYHQDGKGDVDQRDGEGNILIVVRATSHSTPRTSTIAANAVDDNRVTSWSWTPDQCVICSDSMEAGRRLRKTHFDNQAIHVVEVSSEEQALLSRFPSDQQASSPVPSSRSTVASRRSTRSCRRSSGNSSSGSVLVSSHDVLAMLLLKIHQMWPRALPRQQRVYCEGRLLEGLHSSLEALRVLAGCTLHVLIVPEVEGLEEVPSKKKSRSSKNWSEDDLSRVSGGSCDDDGGADDGGEAEMWHIVSVHSNGGCSHRGTDTDHGADGVTDLTCLEAAGQKRKLVNEDGFSGTFLLG